MFLRLLLPFIFASQVISANLWEQPFKKGKFWSDVASEIKLSGMNFSNHTFYDVDFSDADLSNADFTNAYCVGCNFTNANLTSAKFNKAVLSGSDFTDAKLDNAEFYCAYYSSYQGTKLFQREFERIQSSSFGLCLKIIGYGASLSLLCCCPKEIYGRTTFDQDDDLNRPSSKQEREQTIASILEKRGAKYEESQLFWPPWGGLIDDKQE